MNAAFASGARVYLQASGLQVACVVTATKNAYGHNRVQLAPITGSGRTWVDAAKVRPMVTPQPATRLEDLEDVWGFSDEILALCGRTTCNKPCRAHELVQTSAGVLLCQTCAETAVHS